MFASILPRQLIWRYGKSIRMRFRIFVLLKRAGSLQSSEMGNGRSQLIQKGTMSGQNPERFSQKRSMENIGCSSENFKYGWHHLTTVFIGNITKDPSSLHVAKVSLMKFLSRRGLHQ